MAVLMREALVDRSAIMTVNYTEPSWLTEPPEDNRVILGYCANCEEPILAGDTVYCSKYDFFTWYCCEDCFTEAEMLEREVD